MGSNDELHNSIPICTFVVINVSAINTQLYCSNQCLVMPLCIKNILSYFENNLPSRVDYFQNN